MEKALYYFMKFNILITYNMDHFFTGISFIDFSQQRLNIHS